MTNNSPRMPPWDTYGKNKNHPGDVDDKRVRRQYGEGWLDKGTEKVENIERTRLLAQGDDNCAVTKTQYSLFLTVSGYNYFSF